MHLLVSSFVMVDRPTTKSKLHLGKETLSDVHGYIMLAAPKCGATAGSFAVVDASEKIDDETEICTRCFGRSNSCKKLCDLAVTAPRGSMQDLWSNDHLYRPSSMPDSCRRAGLIQEMDTG